VPDFLPRFFVPFGSVTLEFSDSSTNASDISLNFIMDAIQKTSQKPVPDHQRAEESDNATFSGNLIHSGIGKQHSNKSIDMSRAKLPQRFEWVMHNIRKVKTEEILEDDDDELQHAADEGNIVVP
jgi:hypothetical protein